jgi:predicted nuclease with TOPRIM domain
MEELEETLSPVRDRLRQLEADNAALREKLAKMEPQST